MPDPFIISPMKCRGLTWQPPAGPGFAAGHSLIPLHAGEMAEASAAMPLALVHHNGEWQLVGVCGLEPGHNLFVRQGEWLGHYRPQWLTTWPFNVMQAGDKSVVTFDRDSGLLVEEGEAFFDDAGQPVGRTAEVIVTLKASRGKQQNTQKAVAALHEAGVITAWPESFQSRLGMSISGLHMIDERLLATLDDSAFLKLRRAQALPLAYAINLSLTQGHLLTRMARFNPRTPAVQGNLDSFFGDDNDLIFDFEQ